MFMLALVVPLGTVVLTKGLNEVGEVSNRLASGITFENEGGREDIVFEHVRFDPAGNQVIITVRNVGTVESTIIRMTMVKGDTQELLVSEGGLAVGTQPQVGTDISIPADLQFSGRWDDQNYANSDYSISVLTSRGNFFETVARPFNT